MNTNNTLEKIKSGEIVMRSKSYFAARFFAFVVLLFLISIVSVFLLSFIAFSLEQHGRFFPWSLLLIDLVLLCILEQLVRHFQFGYRTPLIYLLVGILFVIFGISFIVDRTPLHRDLLRRAQEKRLPVMGSYYQSFEFKQF